MMRRLIILLVVLAAACACDEQTVEVNVIPKPVSVKVQNGVFVFHEDSRVIPVDDELVVSAGIFADEVGHVLGYPLDVYDGRGLRGDIILTLDESLDVEEYLLQVADDEVLVRGGDPAGVFYGLQTLIQLIDEDNTVNAVDISDKPYFRYRGTHLDVARHFFTVEEVKKYIDILAMHKINRFHWHLTDDQGWRIEIRKYPLLTEAGSVRKQTLVGKHEASNHNYDGIPHGGYYTQDQIREVVAYAADRFITVIPEIDLPGHMQAALTAYPELGCTGGPYELWCRWGISDDVLCAGNDRIYTFLEGVLDEVMELFPSEYIHIGGDECPKVRWEECPKCQAKIRELGLKDNGKNTAEHYLQNHVMSHMEKYLNKHGRKMIGWDEILEGSASETSTIMVWRDHQHAITAIRRGNDVILTPRHYCYFDYCQTSQPEKEPLCVTHRYLSMRQMYRLDPFDRVMLHENSKVLGVQANLWTEYIADFKQVQHMLLPRLAALAETAWSYDRKDTYEEFAKRARTILPDYYNSYGLYYAPYFFQGIE